MALELVDIFFLGGGLFGVSFGGALCCAISVGTALWIQSVLLCRIHKLAVFKVVCTNSVLGIELLCRIFH